MIELHLVSSVALFPMMYALWPQQYSMIKKDGLNFVSLYSKLKLVTNMMQITFYCTQNEVYKCSMCSNEDETHAVQQSRTQF